MLAVKDRFIVGVVAVTGALCIVWGAASIYVGIRYAHDQPSRALIGDAGRPGRSDAFRPLEGPVIVESPSAWVAIWQEEMTRARGILEEFRPPETVATLTRALEEARLRLQEAEKY